MTFNKGSKVAVLPSPYHWARVWPLWNSNFWWNQIHLSENLKLGQCLEIDDTGSLSNVGNVTWSSSHFQTVRYFTDRHITDWSVKYSFFEILTLILIIVQNFVVLSYLEVIFLEASYLRVFLLCRPIIYRPDDLLQFFADFASTHEAWYLVKLSLAYT